MASCNKSWLKLEEKASTEDIELSAKQVKMIKEKNPCFSERHMESSRPGNLLSQDTFSVGILKRVGKVYLHAVVDTFSSYAFVFLYTSNQPETAVAVLYNDVLPFYEERDLQVRTIVTDNGREFCETDTHAYKIYLQLNFIDKGP